MKALDDAELKDCLPALDRLGRLYAEGLDRLDVLIEKLKKYP